MGEGGETTLTAELERLAQEYMSSADDDPTAVFADAELSEPERAVLSNPGVQDRLRSAIREMFAEGAWGSVDDDLALIQPWGFDVAELAVPVEVRYGATDVLVPAAHGRWLAAHIPHAAVVVVATGGT